MPVFHARPARASSQYQALSLLGLMLVMTGSIVCKDASALFNVFGNDVREDVKAENGRYPYPFEALGRLENGCTVSLVGKQLVLTAAHCVVDGETGEIRKDLKEVELDLIDGSSQIRLRIERLWVGTFSPARNRVKDWAILQLTGPVDEVIRRLTPRAVDFGKVKFPYFVKMAGYYGDRRGGRHLSVAPGCAVRETREGLILHDCASTAGLSGAPILKTQGNETFIEAITIGEQASSPTREDKYVSEHANIAIPVTNVIPVLEELLKTADVGIKPPPIEGAFVAEPPTPVPLPFPHPIVAPPPAVTSCNLAAPSFSEGESGSAQLGRIEALFNDDTREVEDVRRNVIGWRSGRCYDTESEQTSAAVLVGESDAEGMASRAVAILNAEDPRVFDDPTPRVREAVRDYLSAISIDLLSSSATRMKFRLTSLDRRAAPRDSIVKEVSCGQRKYFLMHFLLETMSSDPGRSPAFWCYFNERLID